MIAAILLIAGSVEARAQQAAATFRVGFVSPASESASGIGAFRSGLLEYDKRTQAILGEVAAHLSQCGLLVREGALVDATFIAAPPSTKNRDNARDRDMHHAKKGNHWRFGMKSHIGVDAESGSVHSVAASAANECGVAHAHELLHVQVRSRVERPFHVIMNLFRCKKPMVAETDFPARSRMVVPLTG